MDKLNEKMKKIREDANLSLSQLAEKSSLSLAYISKLENGAYQSLSLKTCKALADGLNLTLKDFLEKIGFLNNNERPSFRLIISQALRNNGYTEKQADDVLTYAKILKQMSKSK